MADRKFIRIPAKDLPDLFYVPNDINNPQNGGKNVYFVRYRVTSEDGTLSSTWSPKFETLAVSSIDTELRLSTSEWNASKNGTLVSIAWNVNRLITDKKIFVNKFHVYIRPHTNATESTAKWIFMGETTATNFSTTLIDNNTRADVMVLIPTYRGLEAGTVMPNSPALLYPKSVLFIGINV